MTLRLSLKILVSDIVFQVCLLFLSVFVVLYVLNVTQIMALHKMVQRLDHYWGDLDC